MSVFYLPDGNTTTYILGPDGAPHCDNVESRASWGVYVIRANGADGAIVYVGQVMQRRKGDWMIKAAVEYDGGKLFPSAYAAAEVLASHFP